MLVLNEKENRFVLETQSERDSVIVPVAGAAIRTGDYDTAREWIFSRLCQECNFL